MATLRTIVIETWRDYRDLADRPDFQSWAFRGQAKASWPIDSAIARHLRNAGVHPGAWREQEQRILRIFQRKAHLFLEHVPELADTFQWLALMQHHGAPTRLIDFTWSPYVAAFFALEQATEDACVWAICPRRALDVADTVVKPRPSLDPRESFNFGGRDNYWNIFLPGVHAIVYFGEPYVMNKRLVAQEGTFGVPGIIDKPVEDILASHPDPDRTIVKIVLCTNRIRKEAMRALYNMNITNATLFPDLDGLARSMAYELEFHWAFDPYTMTPTPGFDRNCANDHPLV